MGNRAWWVSWYSTDEMGAFEIHSPWWISGYRCSDEAATVCAAVMAESASDARVKIIRSYDSPQAEIEWRFVEPLDGSPFSDRFPRAEWMVWPE